MSEHGGDKTEQATPKKLEEAFNKGQFARSAEVQTAFVFIAGLGALFSTGSETWHALGRSMVSIFAKLHEHTLTIETLPGLFKTNAELVLKSVGPVAVASMVAGIAAGGLQSRFRLTSEALEANWERLNPISGFGRIFSSRALVPALVGCLKVGLLLGLAGSVVVKIVNDPIFYAAVDLARIAEFLSDSALSIAVRLSTGVFLLAALDYGYQLWRTQQDMMMTKEEVKDEVKNQEGNPHVKSAMRRRRRGVSVRKSLAEVPKADVVVTNPTHLAVALKYDRATMKAPIVVAKGSRLNALKIREIAKAHHVPIIENKPLARLMFKQARVGGEIPAEVYAAVAEILAYVYRTNAYRYYRERAAKNG